MLKSELIHNIAVNDGRDYTSVASLEVDFTYLTGETTVDNISRKKTSADLLQPS